MKRRDFVVAGLVGTGAWSLPAACTPTEVADRRRALLRSWGEQFLLHEYAEFEQACRDLVDRLAELRTEPSTAGLEAAQQAWWRARTPWKRAEVFAFGPYSEEPQRLGPKIDFWPARPDTVERVLVDDTELTAETVASLGAPAKGLHALEYLLFQPDVELVGELTEVPRRAEYALALAEDLVVRAQEIAEAWAPSGGAFLEQLLEAGRASELYPTLNAALGEVVNRMGYTIENIRAEKLAKPLGDSAGGTPQPTVTESPFSQRSLDDIRDNLRGIEQLYFGVAERELLGLDDYLRYRGRNLSRLVRERLDASFAAVDELEPALESAVVSRAADVRTLMSRLADLQRAVQVDVINALSLTVGFNDNDGD